MEYIRVSTMIKLLKYTITNEEQENVHDKVREKSINNVIDQADLVMARIYNTAERANELETNISELDKTATDISTIDLRLEELLETELISLTNYLVSFSNDLRTTID